MKIRCHPLFDRSWRAVWRYRMVDWAILVGLFAAMVFRSPALYYQLPAGRGTAVMCSTVQPRKRRAPAEVAASYSRFSSELQDETSIETQQQKCREAAERDNKTISSAFEFADRAVSGTKLDREGLNQLLAAAEAGQFNTLYFFSLSRLARESIIGLTILKRLAYVLRVRVVSVSEGIDTTREGWELSAQIVSMQHERYVKELAGNVLRGQEAAVKNGYAVGDTCLGYVTRPVPGSEDTRRGRNARPRKVYVIDPETAPWVQRIFAWFVNERRSLRWIARELNRLGAPKDHRSTTAKWRHQYVVKLLKNPKYVGKWTWGKMQNVRDPSTGLVTQVERPTEATEGWVRQMPELRLVDDETFAAAQKLLSENAARHAHRHDDEGKFSHDQNGAATASPVHLLSGLVVCRGCGRTFNIGGAFGKYLFCPGYHQGACSCQTTLNRKLAEALLLDEISSRILANPAWFRAVLESTKASWTLRQRTLPNELRDTETGLAEVARKIGRLLDQVEEQDQPDPSLQERLAQRRAEHRQLEDKLVVLRHKASQAPQEPTAEWVRERLHNLQQVLADATPAAAFALRGLVGGQVVVEEVREDGRKRHYLRGTIHMQLGQVLESMGTDAEQDLTPDGQLAETITIDFVRVNPLDAKAEEAKSLRDQNNPHKEIARLMNCWPSQVTKLLKHWTKIHNQPLPPRSRKVEAESCKFQQIADHVMQRFNAKELLQDIATALGVNRDTVKAAIRWWHEVRGLPVPDCRARRKSLPRKPSTKRPPQDDDPANDCSTS